MAPGRKSQTRLQFTPLPSSSPSGKRNSIEVRDREANVRFEGPPSRHLRNQDRIAIPTPDPSSQIQLNAANPTCDSVSSDPYDQNDIQSPTVKRRRTSAQQPRQITLTPRRSSRVQHQTPLNNPSCSSILSFSPSSRNQRLHSVKIPSATPGQLRRSLKIDKQTVRPSSPSQAGQNLLYIGSPETSGSEDDILTTVPTTQRRRSRKPAVPRDDFVVPDHHNITISSDDDDGPVTPSKRRSSANQTPRRRRLKSRRQQQELKEDLEDLQDSQSPELPSSRTRGAPVNKEWQRRREYIELLKRRRAGEKEPIQVDTDDDEEHSGDAFDYHADNALKQSFDLRRQRNSDQSSSEEDIPDNPELNVDEDDFVVSDEADTPPGLFGRPHPDIPLEFTSYASAKPQDLFKFVIEWLVKKKIAPAFSRHDDLWKLAFNKIEAEVKAQAGSRLKSSAWTGPFMHALNARPLLATRHLVPGENLLQGCDACNRANHPAQYEFIFSGAAYHHDSLEPVDPDSDSDSEAEADIEKASIDSHGHTLPPIGTHFYLGRYCAANAELAHKLTHWKHNLDQALIIHLESHGVLSAEEIVRRERSKGGQKKREKEAEEIVDQMKATGVVDELWKGFKDDLDDARVGMDGFDKRGARGNQRIGSVRVPVSDVFGTAADGHPGEQVGGKDHRDRQVGGRKKETTLFGSDSEGE